eukprot:CAMPEP_0203874494 /NCGR_PEP_ID=MMETSP0359-20131031/20307_1 /ASSEMBLY_ACC=CAM_ASM_000338 /TAXON_ID=268821 /ORGANISM="Scrippsiella Hangoei, Strain SHTV-5" /LENGTH=56 /DNA_ID=CAMNT_0050793243 /DNA_START=44 /DNA_END=211 /DNA_ORIENTATION=+
MAPEATDVLLRRAAVETAASRTQNVGPSLGSSTARALELKHFYGVPANTVRGTQEW